MNLRDDALAIWHEGVRAVDAARLVSENVFVETDAGHTVLVVGSAAFDLESLRRIVVVGAGKAGSAMSVGLEQALRDSVLPAAHGGLAVEGWVNVPEGTMQRTEHIHLEATRPAGVNEPTERGVAASREILRRVRACGPGDLCIVLLSGGGSALMPLPAEGISLADKVCVARVLSGGGASIEQLNVVRKQLSDIKGGKLAAACRSASIATLVISDVLGDPLDLIASGPTIADPSTPADALAVLREFDVDLRIAHVYAFLERHAQSPRPALAAVKAEPVTIIGNNAVAVDGAGMEAERRGYSHAMTSVRRSEGSAESIGRHLAEMALAMLSAEHGQHEPDCLISGGEPVVTLAPPAIRGRGGRNQQLVLAALDHWMHHDPPLTPQQRECILLLSGGTDGEDGPTDAAGAYVDADVWRQAERLGLDPADFLRRNDAYTFFAAVGGLLRTGPTHTNVCDVRVMLVRSPRDR